MFTRLRTLLDGKPRVGDLVIVHDGPYAGRSGTITAVDGALSTVYIDECCQPKLAHMAFQRQWKGRWMRDRQFKARTSDREADVAREYLDRIDGV
jgi:ribosomal protein L24